MFTRVYGFFRHYTILGISTLQRVRHKKWSPTLLGHSIDRNLL